MAMVAAMVPTAMGAPMIMLVPTMVFMMMLVCAGACARRIGGMAFPERGALSRARLLSLSEQAVAEPALECVEGAAFSTSSAEARGGFRGHISILLKRIIQIVRCLTFY